MSETIGFSQKPTLRLGKREHKIIDYLRNHWNLGERLKDIIEACERINLNHLSVKQRKKPEIYYLSSLNSLIRKDLVWKDKRTEETKLYEWDRNPNILPSHHSTLASKLTLFILNNEALDLMEKSKEVE